MLRGTTVAETLHLNGWQVGDILSGDEGYGAERILITEIGESRFRCRWMHLNDTEFGPVSNNTTLKCREWVKTGTIHSSPQGLPALQTECEYFYPEGEQWRRGRCVAHYRGKAIVVDSQDETATIAHDTRPIQTPDEPWQCVPMEPTEDMTWIGYNLTSSQEDAAAIYRLMLTEAPKPEDV